MNNVTVSQDFFDGSLATEFLKLGYPSRWKSGERRNIPDTLANRIVASGGVLVIADANAKESKIIIPAESVELDAEKVYQEQHKKVKKIEVMFPGGFRDGTLRRSPPGCRVFGRRPCVSASLMVLCL